MIMTKLYPIGTQLITKRLSQAALYEESFCWKAIESFSAYEGQWKKGFKTHVGDDFISCWRVTVTEDNQELLSPVPMVGDLVDVYKEYSVFTPIYLSKFEFKSLENPSAIVKRIILRTYPNGQRAPLIEWDEVILPIGQTPETHPAP